MFRPSPGGLRNGDVKEAVRYAYRLLSYRDRSEGELLERLNLKGFPADSIHGAVEFLRDKGYLNDSALAGRLKREARDVRGMGARGARAFMLRRGIPRDVAEGELEDYEELEGARRVAEKKLRSLEGQAREVARRRLSGMLSRKGFSAETVRKVLREML